MASWIPDTLVKACQACNSEFGLLTRRHHCRLCGKIFCNLCSAKQIKNVRCCDVCYEVEVKRAVQKLPKTAAPFASSPYPLNQHNSNFMPKPVQHILDDCFGSFCDLSVIPMAEWLRRHRDAIHMSGATVDPVEIVDPEQFEDIDGVNAEEEADLFISQPKDIIAFYTKVDPKKKTRLSLESRTGSTNNPLEMNELLDALSQPSLKLKISSSALQDKNAFLRIINSFIDEFEYLRFCPQEDYFQSTGRFKLVKVLLYYVSRNERIQCVVPAFPCKSPNYKTKVLGTLPDRGEEASLQRLDEFCRRINALYKPGCEIVVMTDGIVFADIIGVSNETLNTYWSTLKTMLPSDEMANLKWDRLEDHVDGDPIEHMLKNWETKENLAKLAVELKGNGENTLMYRGLMRFLLSDRMWADDVSISKRKKLCGEAAKKMIVRNIGFSTLVGTLYPNSVRLSIHGHNNSGPKYGIRLLADVPFCSTPWHNVIVRMTDGREVMMKKEEAEALDNCTLQMKNDQPWCYVLQLEK